MMKRGSRTTASLDLPRRHFLSKSAALIGGSLVGSAVPAMAQECRITEADIIGPFYRVGAPFQTKLAGPDEPGERLTISGTVFGADCRTPLPNAFIEVWQANSGGVYDTSTPGNFTETTSFHLRGVMYTDEKGQYRIDTIMPGRYPIPPGLAGLEQYAGMTRPAHIHFRVMESVHVPLTTQLYFKDDPFLATDPWAGPKQTLAIELTQDGERRLGTFDIALARGF